MSGKAISTSYTLENIILGVLLFIVGFVYLIFKIFAEYFIKDSLNPFYIIIIILFLGLLFSIVKKQALKQNENTVTLYKIKDYKYRFLHIEFTANEITSIHEINKIFGLKEYYVHITKISNNAFNDISKYIIRVKEKGFFIIPIPSSEFSSFLSLKKI